MSYYGKVTISIIGDRDIMPDPSFYRECLEKSFAKLKAAALKKGKLIKHKTKAELAASRKQKANDVDDKNPTIAEETPAAT
jgi:hypothetical protein